MASERDYILNHRKRLVAQAAGEPYAKALIDIYNHEAPMLVIHPDGHLECLYPSQGEIDRIREQWSKAVESALRLAEHGFY